MILTIIVFILILGLLIFAHELGHFISAKKAGVKVEEFGFGFPPRIFGIKKGETTYSLNAVPLGGFVKIFGEDSPSSETTEDEERSKSPRAFYNKPIWKRAIILVMGVVMNLIIAIILLSVVHMLGVPTIVEQGQEKNYKNIQIQIVETAKNSPAENAEIKVGDSILELKIKNEKLKINDIEDVQKFIAFHVGEEITITVKRGDKILEKNLTPRVDPPKEEGALGIAMSKTGLISYPWYKAILKGFETTGKLAATMVLMFWILIKTLLLQGKIIGEIAGPVGIAVLTSQVVHLGWIYVLQFAAILSINLAIINILPFPALDGGRLLFLLIEKIKGSPIKFKTERLAHALGFIILIGLMLIITLRDVIKLF
ncbi:MAG TPA: RIP metalloprotease RseP [Candidatus Portnoybacteria bacterium]|jgi:regulator of sigma E protease|nr:RIP metalloprotease RseP [Candidatus Portnoybacteria bacterium]MDD5752223.1 RIP metalloprotease RseP [Candidatus Portnoybacteria bacterium]HNU96763.1 RIP metalloprotease RseP [Candidatus Portnoybacteria bacterium]HOZ16487.1 RIP metalloprotease RseP [Candidatus Portnoybacteria bacterium]HPH52247.1 RIP metalloprotease RseP [Candidatus Portnoybacteria bacterium]